MFEFTPKLLADAGIVADLTERKKMSCFVSFYGCERSSCNLKNCIQSHFFMLFARSRTPSPPMCRTISNNDVRFCKVDPLLIALYRTNFAPGIDAYRHIKNGENRQSPIIWRFSSLSQCRFYWHKNFTAIFFRVRNDNDPLSVKGFKGRDRKPSPMTHIVPPKNTEAL